MKILYWLVSIVVMLSMTACLGGLIDAKDPLEKTSWELVYIRKSAPIAGRPITIIFEDGEVRGSSGCNTYFGSYQVEGEQIRFSPLAMTEMACMEPDGIMQQEQEYLAFLAEVVSFQINEDQLVLKKEVQDQLTFKLQK